MTAPSVQSLHTKHKRNPTTREKCAASTGYSHTTLDKVDQVQHLADDTTASAELRALAAEALRKMDTTGKVDGPYQRVMGAADPDGWRCRRGRQPVAKVRTIVATSNCWTWPASCIGSASDTQYSAPSPNSRRGTSQTAARDQRDRWSREVQQFHGEYLCYT